MSTSGHGKWRTLAVAAIAVLLLGASDPAPAQAPVPAGPRVEIHGESYDTPDLTVTPGTIVTWVNRDDDTHTVTSTTDVFRSPGLDTDETFSYTFTQPGTYTYFCTLHPTMTGRVVVRSGS